MSTDKKIMLVEDHPVFRMGLSQLIERQEGLSVCGEAEDIGTALMLMEKELPDLVVLDLSLKGRSGLELIKEVRQRFGDLPVLVLSMYDEVVYAERVLSAGANGYVMKKEASVSIVFAIRRVLDGGVYLTDSMTREVLGKLAGQRAGSENAFLGKLTDRELEVFQLIGKGRKTAEIAQQLALSTKTISTYKERIKEKLKLKSSAELIRHAIRWEETQSR